MHNDIASVQDTAQEIVPGLFLGPAKAARPGRNCLVKRIGCTHIVLAAQEHEAQQHFPELKYHLVKLVDRWTSQLCHHFDSTNDFIRKALSSCGCVLVHCVMGISRSPTCA